MAEDNNNNKIIVMLDELDLIEKHMYLLACLGAQPHSSYVDMDDGSHPHADVTYTLHRKQPEHMLLHVQDFSDDMPAGGVTIGHVDVHLCIKDVTPGIIPGNK